MKTSKRSLEEELRRGTTKASWECRNEGVHERVNFDDTIWGFSLAGGIYYKTPLRVTSVRENSRANLAGIKPGDVLKRINDIDTSTLTIQEAHDMIVESGINIRLAVSAPDDLETRYNVWQDEYVEEEEEKRKKFALRQTKIHKEFKGAKTNANWSMLWPWTNKRTPFYRESNCFLVPSQYEEKYPYKIGAAHPVEESATMNEKSAMHKSNIQCNENSKNDHEHQVKVEHPKESMFDYEIQEEIAENLDELYDDYYNNDEKEENVDIESETNKEFESTEDISDIEEISMRNSDVGDESALDDDDIETVESQNEAIEDLQEIPEYIGDQWQYPEAIDKAVDDDGCTDA